IASNRPRRNIRKLPVKIFIARANQIFCAAFYWAYAPQLSAQEAILGSDFASRRFAVSTRSASAKAEDTVTESVSRVSKFGKAMAEEGYRRAMAVAEEGRAAAQQTAQDFQTLSVTLASKLMGFASENLSASMQASRDFMACRSWQDVAALNASLMQDCT